MLQDPKILHCTLQCQEVFGATQKEQRRQWQQWSNLFDTPWFVTRDSYIVMGT